MEFASVDLTLIAKDTAAVLFYLDGGSRNFHRVRSVKLYCTRTRLVADSQFRPGDEVNEVKLCHSSSKPGKDAEMVALGVLYSADDLWILHHIQQPILEVSPAEQLEHLQMIVVSVIPAFEQFKVRQFPSVPSICAALSSHSLPLMKVCCRSCFSRRS